MKVCRSPIPAQRSYKQFKKHKIEKKINGLCQIRTWDLLLPRPALYHWATEFDMKWRGKLFNRSYIIIIASLTLYPPVLIKNSTVQWLRSRDNSLLRKEHKWGRFQRIEMELQNILLDFMGPEQVCPVCPGHSGIFY